MLNRVTQITYWSLIGCALIGSGHAATIIAHDDAPAVQATTVLEAPPENVDSSSRGTFTSVLGATICTFEAVGDAVYAIVSSDVNVGGSDTGSDTNLEAQSGPDVPATTLLSAPTSLLGFWWSAGDSFYSGNERSATITAANIISVIPIMRLLQ